MGLVSQTKQAELNRNIQKATNLRDQLESCIGCGCRPMKARHLLNAHDHLAKEGAGPTQLAMQAVPLSASESV